MKKMLLAFAAFSMFFLTNCDKDDDDDDDIEPSLTTESLSGNYKLTSFKVKEGALPEVEAIGFLQACIVDDITTLKSDFTYTKPDGGIKCTPPGDESGTWGLPGNNKIEIDGLEYDVLKWDGKDLQGKASEVDPDTGETVSITITYTRQ